MRLCLVVFIALICCTSVYTKNSYTSVNCIYNLPLYQVECGRLTVPQSRQDSGYGSIDLAIVIIHSLSKQSAPDPVVYLAGGPGGSSTPYTEGLVQMWFKPFLETRDVILVDQRGTGRSEPSLACDEYSHFMLNQISTETPPPQTITDEAAALYACQQRLTREGILTSAYTSAESAADLNDLRVALNIKEWNLLGVSYGTRLALTVLRDHPQGVRSVILDSVYPPQVALFTDVYANGERARQAVFAACAAQSACAAAYPDLENRFWQLVASLNAQPVTVTIRLERTTRDFVWTGDRLYNLVFLWMYARDDITLIPSYIDMLWRGQFSRIDLLRAALSAELSSLSVSMGLYMSVQCGEERPVSLSQERHALLTAYPRLRSLLEQDLWLSDTGDLTCRQWQPAPPAALENTPVASTVPTLLLSGAFDPVTPPAWAQLAAQTLPQSQLLIVPEIGHGVIRSSGCVAQLASAYLDHPTQTVETSCLSSIPPLMFAVPAGDNSDQSPRL